MPGDSTRDIEDTFRHEVGQNLVSRSGVSRVTKALWEENTRPSSNATGADLKLVFATLWRASQRCPKVRFNEHEQAQLRRLQWIICGERTRPLDRIHLAAFALHRNNP